VLRPLVGIARPGVLRALAVYLCAQVFITCELLAESLLGDRAAAAAPLEALRATLGERCREAFGRAAAAPSGLQRAVAAAVRAAFPTADVAEEGVEPKTGCARRPRPAQRDGKGRAG